MFALPVMHFRYKLLIALLAALPLLIVLPPLLWTQGNRQMYEEVAGKVPEGFTLTGAHRNTGFQERTYLFVLKQDAQTEFNPSTFSLSAKPAVPDDVAYGVSIYPDIVPRQWKKLQLYQATSEKSSEYINIIYDKDHRTIYLITLSQ